MLFPAGKVYGLDLGGQPAVHQGDGLFGLEIAHLAQSPQEHGGAQATGEFHRESVPRLDIHVADARGLERRLEEPDAFLCGEQRGLAGIERHHHVQALEQFPAPRHQVQMAQRGRVEGPGMESDGHERFQS